MLGMAMDSIAMCNRKLWVCDLVTLTLLLAFRCIHNCFTAGIFGDHLESAWPLRCLCFCHAGLLPNHHAVTDMEAASGIWFGSPSMILEYSVGTDPFIAPLRIPSPKSFTTLSMSSHCETFWTDGHRFVQTPVADLVSFALPWRQTKPQPLPRKAHLQVQIALALCRPRCKDIIHWCNQKDWNEQHSWRAIMAMDNWIETAIGCHEKAKNRTSSFCQRFPPRRNTKHNNTNSKI